MPGSSVVHKYCGCVEQPFELRLVERICFMIAGLHILEHPHPLALLGIDVLCWGCEPPGWNYIGHNFYETGGGCLKFKFGDAMEDCSLHFMPISGTFAHPAMLLLFEALPPAAADMGQNL